MSPLGLQGDRSAPAGAAKRGAEEVRQQHNGAGGTRALMQCGSWVMG